MFGDVLNTHYPKRANAHLVVKIAYLRQICDNVHDFAWQIAPDLLSVAPQIFISEIRVIVPNIIGILEAHEGSSRALCILSIIKTFTNIDSEVLEVVVEVIVLIAWSFRS